jgi:hypothetical protein
VGLCLAAELWTYGTNNYTAGTTGWIDSFVVSSGIIPVVAKGAKWYHWFFKVRQGRHAAGHACCVPGRRGVSLQRLEAAATAANATHGAQDSLCSRAASVAGKQQPGALPCVMTNTVSGDARAGHVHGATWPGGPRHLY